MKMVWETLMQGHIYYCSQLYHPLQSGNLTRIELLDETEPIKYDQPAKAF